MKDEPKKPRVVLDTNVFFSMLAFPGSRLDSLMEEELERNLKKKLKPKPMFSSPATCKTSGLWVLSKVSKS